MKYLAALALATCALLSTPALAQANGALFTSSDVEAIVPPVDHDCILGPGAKTATGEQKIANCDAAVADLNALAAKATTPARKAGFAYIIASFEFARAGGYLKVDTVRSRRVCTATEHAYAMISSADLALFDAGMAQSVTNSRKSMSNAAGACRNDFGTPAGAPALVAS